MKISVSLKSQLRKLKDATLTDNVVFGSSTMKTLVNIVKFSIVNSIFVLLI